METVKLTLVLSREALDQLDKSLDDYVDLVSGDFTLGTKIRYVMRKLLCEVNYLNNDRFNKSLPEEIVVDLNLNIKDLDDKK